MALFLFTKAILAGEPIDVFNHGKMVRDFTYIDDIAAGVVHTLDRPPQADPGYDKAAADTASSWAPYKVFNIGNHDPVPLMDFIAAIERHTGKAANKVLMDIQPGDVPATYADVAALEAWTGFKPATSIDDGVGRFVAWYRGYWHRLRWWRWWRRFHRPGRRWRWRWWLQIDHAHVDPDLFARQSGRVAGCLPDGEGVHEDGQHERRCPETGTEAGEIPEVFDVGRAKYGRRVHQVVVAWPVLRETLHT
jgi:hypothetical protein